MEMVRIDIPLQLMEGNTQMDTTIIASSLKSDYSPSMAPETFSTLEASTKSTTVTLIITVMQFFA